MACVFFDQEKKRDFLLKETVDFYSTRNWRLRFLNDTFFHNKLKRVHSAEKTEQIIFKKQYMA
jgi:hypothetical protein